MCTTVRVTTEIREPQRHQGQGGALLSSREQEIEYCHKEIKGKLEQKVKWKGAWKRKIKKGIWRGTTNTKGILKSQMKTNNYYGSFQKYIHIGKNLNGVIM